MYINHTTGNKMPSQEHINFINKLNDTKIPRQNQLIANRLFMKNFPRETTGADIENFFQSFGPVHDVKIIAKENTHFAFISFVNENTALDVLRQHAIVPLTFQSRPMILAPAYKKNIIPLSTSPSSYYLTGGSTMTPPPTPSRTTVNGMSQQPSTPYHYQQQQQSLSTPHCVYPPIFFPMQANMPFVQMNGTYIIPQGLSPSHHPQLPPSFYPTFYTQGANHQSGGQFINGHAYIQSPYMYSMGPPSVPTHYQPTTTNDMSMTSEY
jgi:RNA recognition motif-containing protein